MYAEYCVSLNKRILCPLYSLSIPYSLNAVRNRTVRRVVQMFNLLQHAAKLNSLSFTMFCVLPCTQAVERLSFSFIVSTYLLTHYRWQEILCSIRDTGIYKYFSVNISTGTNSFLSFSPDFVNVDCI